MNVKETMRTTASVLEKHNRQIETLIGVGEKLFEHGIRLRKLVESILHNQLNIANNQVEMADRILEIERRLDETR